MAHSKITIALDAMGGDNAPEIIIKGAEEALLHHPNLNFLLFGDEQKIDPFLDEHPKLKEHCKVVHTEEFIASDARPGVALRQGRNSSMGLAIKAVRDGEADGIVSAGNTGALMAMSKFLLKTLPGIARPAIAGVMPTTKGDSIILDVGANVDCDANNLFQFAIMGDAYAKILLGYDNPSIGILNIGSEDIKGNEAVKGASEMLRNTDLPLNFHGHVEGNHINEGVVDVVVTDGFSGNISLKTVEGCARMCSIFLKEALESSALSKTGGLLAKPALTALFKKLDPEMYNGGIFLGLNGIVVKSHGGAKHLGFANSIGVAVKLVDNDMNNEIVEEIKATHTDLPEQKNSSPV